ncbi:unnamed protein product (macronuclear) [Paramecium tetraurelia]|uniref:Trimethylguanosine synthase n=1 Tax=Paramecium tetraurelia TaxID=5888 RepID=A0C6P5_PARTE|nr:uncharacterized protein GSPATT00035591001 [Paramecium tetraurelia]CAK66462.1 unnamed protein product [Paramecium tetraurelia]|eukprot:XP_001433859.1 hypothetical protein (macronuclear) [Paramecium tetraurelia strain d4-2]
MKKFCNFICCALDSDEEKMGEEKQISIKKEEKTSLELYGNFETQNYMLVRMTQKNFFVDFSMRKSKLVEKNPLSVFISYIDNDAKYEQDESSYLIPEKVLQYIGRRMREVKPSFIVDGLSRSGINAIQFSSETNTFVLGNNFSMQQIKNANHNATICNLNIRCDFLQTNLPKLPIIENDVFFIQPDYQIIDGKLTLNNIFPSISDILDYYLVWSKNLILVLPIQVDLQAFCEVFCQNLKEKNQDQLIFEIQKIQIDGELYYYFIYFGEIAAIQTQDEYMLMTEMTLEDSNQQNLFDSTYMLLKNIGYTTNPREIMNILLYSRQMSQFETTLQVLINQLLIKGLSNESTIKQLFGDADVLLSSTPKYNQIQVQENTFGQDCQIKQCYEQQQTQKNKKAKKSQFISFNIPSE